ncbi:hypothetical protein DFA_05523 [Cavenderia fasciculata]|uniref:Uncharacterized protein n=1 Tax=Cavenderia fasciculata TaxID=261658 RepID=F4PLG9_CACFS|nr:uncharacterized protein DFA_05523 [Cavenderia fasciculata]EGG23391.1 hypothetical protein DFA_05523 [Cavenderia fasciculata]|eukprot:XP_004361242.1 hypothetical protein DFA_05523 [Cavenderia fasciculata]
MSVSVPAAFIKNLRRTTLKVGSNALQLSSKLTQQYKNLIVNTFIWSSRLSNSRVNYALSSPQPIPQALGYGYFSPQNPFIGNNITMTFESRTAAENIVVLFNRNEHIPIYNIRFQGAICSIEIQLCNHQDLQFRSFISTTSTTSTTSPTT